MKVNPYENVGFRGLNSVNSGKTSQLSRSTPIRDQVTFSSRKNESPYPRKTSFGGELGQNIGAALNKISNIFKGASEVSNKPAAGDLTGRGNVENIYTF